MNNRTKVNTYKIPDFSVSDIVQYFTDLQIPISIEDITKPNTTALVTLYETVLEIYPNVKVIDLLDNTCSEAQYYAILCNALNRVLFTELGVTNFTFKDLIQPTSNRTISFLSAIVNFSMYRDSKRNIYLNIVNTMTEKDEFFMSLDDRMVQARSRLNELESKRDLDEKEIEKIEVDIQKNDSSLREKIKLYRDKANKVEELKNVFKDLEDKSSSNQLIRVNLEREYKILTSQVISDPERLLNAIQEMKKMLNDEKDYYRRLENKIDECRMEKTNFDEKINEIKHILKVAVEHKNKFAEKESKIVYRNDIFEKMNSCENEICRIQKIIEINKKRIDFLNLKLVNLDNRMKEINKEAIEKKKSLNEERKNQLNFSKTSANKIDEKSKELKELNEEVHRLNEFFDRQFNEIKKEMSQVEENTTSYFENLYNSI